MIIDEIIDVNSILDGEYECPLYDKFVEAYRTDDLDVLTPNGWINIEGVGKTIEYDEYLVSTGHKEIKCADDHILYRCDNMDFHNMKCDITEIFCKDLVIGDFIMTCDGPEMVIEYGSTGRCVNMYDLQLSDGSDKQYYTNGILSHNSLWMQNFAVASSNVGYNVLYISLEMSVKKCLKRTGSMRLKIPINDYDSVSNDIDFMKKKIEALHNSGKGGGDLFNYKVGKLITKFYPAGTATVLDFDSLLENIKNRKGINIDLIVVDYLTLVAPSKGMGFDNNLYMKGKSIAEGLRAVGAKYNCPIISAVQVSKDAWNANDITLDKIPESKAIAETADTFFAIIRTEEMKRQNIYRLKLLKQRDGDFMRSQVKFELNPKYLTIENDVFVDTL